MSNCSRCESERVLRISAGCADRCVCNINGQEKDGYPPKIQGICGNDMINTSICLDCGQVQGNFPIPTQEFELLDEDEE